MNPIATELATALDPVRFAIHKLGFIPDEWQARVLRSTAKTIQLLCSRQVGKSTISAVKGLHTALYRPQSTILIVSPTQRQSGELAVKFWGYYNDLKNPIPSVSKTKLTLELTNGSRIVSLPSSPDGIRGFSSVDLCILDESAFFDHDDILYTVKPMLAVSDGQLMLLSSAGGKRGFFYDSWVHPNDYEKIKVTADDCSRISSEFLDSERLNMPSWRFMQEYYCQFSSNQFGVFASDDIQNAVKDVELWDL